MKINGCNPFADEKIASGYEMWYQNAGRRADKQEKILLNWLLRFFPTAECILEVGCGTGHFTRWFEKGLGLQAFGFDLSHSMLSEAKALHTPRLVQGDAGKIPFPSKSVDIVVLITTLEFLADPMVVIKEAYRLARQGILLGVINKHSILGVQNKLSGGPVWDNAQFFTISKMKKMLRGILGSRIEIIWRTTLWPMIPWYLPLPWGGFIGMAVKWRNRKEGIR